MSELSHKRADDIIQTYRRLAESHRRIKMSDMFVAIASEPASRFYITPERAVVVVRRILRGEEIRGMRPLKLEMYKEIASRVGECRRRKPGMSLLDAVRTVVESPAPKYYITQYSAKVIFYKAWKRWTRENMRKLLKR